MKEKEFDLDYFKKDRDYWRSRADDNKKVVAVVSMICLTLIAITALVGIFFGENGMILLGLAIVGICMLLVYFAKGD